MNSVLNVEVSCFRNYESTKPVNVNLLTWLTSPKYQKEVEAIRLLTDKKQRDDLKAKLPTITPSGIFSQRHEVGLIKHSALIQFDIDLKSENTFISNWDELKTEIFKIRHVAYIGLSVSGKGYWGLIPISNPAEHKPHFKAIERMFGRFGIKIDTAPSNVASPRGYSYDPDALFRHDAVVLKGMIKPEPITARKPPKDGNFRTNSNIEEILRQLIINAADGEKHTILNKAAFLAGGYIAGGQIDEQLAIDLLTDEIQSKPNVKDLKAAIKTIHRAVQNGKTKPILRDGLKKTELSKPSSPPTVQTLVEVKTIEQPEPVYSFIKPDQTKTESWSNDIAELENYFVSIELPTQPIKLNRNSVITNISQFIDSHLQTVKANDGKERFRPYLTRLQELKQKLC
jgi:hypothetical protein